MCGRKDADVKYLAFLFAFLVSAAVQAQEIQKVEITEFGLYQRGAVVAEEPPTANAFGRAQVAGWKHLRTTRKVPARIGTTFGFRFKTVGKPVGEIVPIVQATLLPPEGAKSPKGARPFTRDVYPSYAQIGGEDAWMFTFDYPWEMVPGIWTVQFWHGKKKISEQLFEVIVPPTV